MDKLSTHLPAGDWPEDFEHENGDYMNRCFYCERMFFGHKRRMVCKVCALNQPKPEESPPPMKEPKLPEPHAWLEIDENVFGQPVYRGVVHWTPDEIAGEHRRVPVYTAEQMRAAILAERDGAGMAREVAAAIRKG